MNACSADSAGEHVIEPHDGLGPGSGGHEELYRVLAGAAWFTSAGADVEAPGGRTGAALPVSPF